MSKHKKVKKSGIIYQKLSNKYEKNRRISIISNNKSSNILMIFQRMMEEDKPTCSMEYRLGMKTTKLMLSKHSALTLVDIILAHYHDEDRFDNNEIVQLVYKNKFKIETVEDH